MVRFTAAAIDHLRATTELRRVLENSSGGVLIAVACVLDELALRLLVPFRLALTGFDERSLRIVWLLRIDRIRLRAGTTADSCRFGSRLLGLLPRWIWTWHDSGLPAAVRSKRVRVTGGSMDAPSSEASVARLEVPQPGEPATPAVPDAPVTPIDPDPGTPADPERPATVPEPDEPPTPAVPEPRPDDPDRSQSD